MSKLKRKVLLYSLVAFVVLISILLFFVQSKNNEKQKLNKVINDWTIKQAEDMLLDYKKEKMKTYEKLEVEDHLILDEIKIIDGKIEEVKSQETLSARGINEIFKSLGY